MRPLLVFIAACLLLVGGAVVVLSSGWIDVAANASHSGPVEWLLEHIRERSVEARAERIRVPPLDDPARLSDGAALYRELCSGCHGAPGIARSAVGRGLNPTPPDLASGIRRSEAAEAYWVTSHGIRMTGMPAFGESLGEDQIWSLVALLVAMDGMSPEAYGAMLRSVDHAAGEPEPPSDP